MIVAHVAGIPVEESILYMAGVVAIAPALLVLVRSRVHRLGRRRRRPLSD
jgi:hypothetical protein